MSARQVRARHGWQRIRRLRRGERRAGGSGAPAQYDRRPALVGRSSTRDQGKLVHLFLRAA